VIDNSEQNISLAIFSLYSKIECNIRGFMAIGGEFPIYPK